MGALVFSAVPFCHGEDGSQNQVSGATRPAGFAMLGQVPPELLVHAFFGIDVAIDRFLADAQFGAFIDHPVADLFRRPTLFDPRDHGLAELWMPDQFALLGTALLRALVCCHPKISRILFRESIIGPEVAFDLAKNR